MATEYSRNVEICRKKRLMYLPMLMYCIFKFFYWCKCIFQFSECRMLKVVVVVNYLPKKYYFIHIEPTITFPTEDTFFVKNKTFFLTNNFEAKLLMYFFCKI